MDFRFSLGFSLRVIAAPGESWPQAIEATVVPCDVDVRVHLCKCHACAYTKIVTKISFKRDRQTERERLTVDCEYMITVIVCVLTVYVMMCVC